MIEEEFKTIDGFIEHRNAISDRSIQDIVEENPKHKIYDSFFDKDQVEIEHTDELGSVGNSTQIRYKEQDTTINNRKEQTDSFERTI